MVMMKMFFVSSGLGFLCTMPSPIIILFVIGSVRLENTNDTMDISQNLSMETDQNTTMAYMAMKEQQFTSKRERLISFNNDDNTNVDVELGFSIPFISIPVKKTMDMTKGALANVNVGAIVLSGLIMIGAVLAPPLLTYLFNLKQFSSGTFFNHTEDAKHRRTENSYDWITEFLANTDQILSKNNLDSSNCLQRVICWFVKGACLKVAKGSGTSRDKIIDGVANNEWFKSMVEDTIFQTAIEHGLMYNSNCSKQFAKCKISQRNVQAFLKDFLKKIGVNN